MKRALLLLPLLFLLSSPAAGDGPPYPPGSTSQTIEGLRVQLVIPKDYDPEKKYSLIVVLHGAGGTETGMAGSLEPLAAEGFVVCAPKSTDQTWSASDLEKVKAIITHLTDVLSIGEGRLHGMGFSNGGWNLAPIVFDEELPFVSACWMAAGYNGGKVPRRAKKEMGCIALAGSDDPNRGAAEKTVDLLADKVRTVECRIQPGIGHEFCRELMPYYFYWLKAMEGRFAPGEDLSFDWTDDVEAAKQRMAAQKLGGFVYFWSAKDDREEETKRVQNEVFFDRWVRRFGNQLVAVKLEREKNEELFGKFKLKETPAVVVLKPDFDVEKDLEGKKIKESSLAKALRSVAKDKTIPR